MADDTIHTPVLLERTLELLAPALGREGAVVVDGTLGMGGHAEAMLQRHPGLTLVGIDRDTEALAIAGERLAPFADRIHLVHAVYDELARVLRDLGTPRVSAVLLDLGVSSLQLDRVERGFSYSKDAPLDMRMDATSERTAALILATYSESELRRIFYEYGDEKLAPRFASRIVQRRVERPLETSAELVELIIAATPAAAQRAGHPAKRVFQALRIEVNQELAVLERTIPDAVDALEVGGRIVVLAYQSLEDRIVKRTFRSLELRKERAYFKEAGDRPIPVGEAERGLVILTKKPVEPADDEVAANPASRSAKLRVARAVGGARS